MSQPWGYRHRGRRGLRGLLARWWYRHRVQQIRRAQRRRSD